MTNDSRLTPDALRQALQQHPLQQIPALPGRRNHLRAGVLVPLLFDPAPAAILTLRAPRLKHHAGEVCFPGGQPDAADDDLLQTALREAREELGIERAELLGRLSSMPVYTSDYRLVPFVAAIDAACPLRPAPGEVQRVLRLGLLEVLDQRSIEGIPFRLGATELLFPIFRPDGEVLFGATANTFFELLLVVAELLGRDLPPMSRSSLEWTDLRPNP